MITTQEADKIILTNVEPVMTELCPLAKSSGRILRENIFLDRDQPPFDKALMDGIAIDIASWLKGNRGFNIEGIQPAGKREVYLKDKNACIEIMTGAVLPHGTNAIIPVEDIKVENQVAFVSSDIVKRYQNIRFKGSDAKKDHQVLKSGCQLLPPCVAIIASTGKPKVKVSHMPNIAIISTGDELIAVGKTMLPSQTRISNAYALKAIFEQTQFLKAATFHIKDDKKQLLKKIEHMLNKFDCLVLSGGVSMGKFDYIPHIMQALNVKLLFHKVRQKPGKPFWFGKTKNKKPIFALPGNPVSTQICAYRYVLPYFKKNVGLKSLGQTYALFERHVKNRSGLTYFCPVRVVSEDKGKRVVRPIAYNGSGDFASLAQAHGFVELNEYKKVFRQDDPVPFYGWRFEG